MDCMFFFFKVGSIFLGDQLKLHLLLDSYEITRDSEILVPMIRSSCHVWPCCTYHCLPGMTLKPSGSLVLPVHCVSYMDKINMSGPMFSRSLLLRAAFRAEKSFRNLKSALGICTSHKVWQFLLIINCKATRIQWRTEYFYDTDLDSKSHHVLTVLQF